MENSSILLVDAHLAIQNHEENSIVHEETDIFENSSAVETLQYNPLRPNLIAIGGERVFIMDIQINQGQIDPNFFQPDFANSPHENSTVTAVSWN